MSRAPKSQTKGRNADIIMISAYHEIEHDDCKYGFLFFVILAVKLLSGVFFLHERQ